MLSFLLKFARKDMDNGRRNSILVTLGSEDTSKGSSHFARHLGAIMNYEMFVATAPSERTARDFFFLCMQNFSVLLQACTCSCTFEIHISKYKWLKYIPDIGKTFYLVNKMASYVSSASGRNFSEFAMGLAKYGNQAEINKTDNHLITNTANTFGHCK